MSDNMIDLETLGTGPFSPIISIGIVCFDLNNVLDKLYITLDVKDQIDSGKRKIDADTLKWWMSQSDAAKKVFKENPMPVKEALMTISEFIKKQGKDVHVWGNGATFDITLLETLFSQYEVPVPWKYSKVMDFRTIKRFLGKDVVTERKGTYHNALDDALTQAEFVQACLQNYYQVEK